MRQRRSSRRRSSGSARNRRLRWILVILAVLVIIGILFACHAIKPPELRPSDQEEEGEQAEEEVLEGEVLKIEGADRKEGFYTFLVCGCDQSGTNTDTIIVGAYDSKAKTVNMVSIPRDTMINVSWSVKKINGAYLHGGIEGLQKELKKIMGFVPDCYAVVDLKAFEELVDCIGGVRFNVPQNMDYSDPDQKLEIHLKAGEQLLSGHDAVGVMRFRSGYADADIGRIATQQAFIKAFAKQCLSIGNVTKVDEFASIFKQYVETDMSLGNIVWYGKEFLGLDMANINFQPFPANTGISVRGGSYVGIYVSEWVKTINEYLNPFTTEIKAGNLNVLTKEGGRVYSTSGVIAGGEDSFLNYYALTGRPDPEKAARQIAEDEGKKDAAEQEKEETPKDGAEGSEASGTEEGSGAEGESAEGAAGAEENAGSGNGSEGASGSESGEAASSEGGSEGASDGGSGADSGASEGGAGSAESGTAGESGGTDAGASDGGASSGSAGSAEGGSSDSGSGGGDTVPEWLQEGN